MASRRLTAKLKRGDAVAAARIALKHERLVYVILAGKAMKYLRGRSRIVYIGTTERGLSRIAESVAYRADKVLGLHGVKRMTVRVVACTIRRGKKPAARKGKKEWFLLERALLLRFIAAHGEGPKCNAPSKLPKLDNVWDVFRKDQVSRIIADLGRKPRGKGKHA